MLALLPVACTCCRQPVRDAYSQTLAERIQLCQFDICGMATALLALGHELGATAALLFQKRARWALIRHLARLPDAALVTLAQELVLLQHDG